MIASVSRRRLVTFVVAGAVALGAFVAGRASADQPHMQAALEALKTAEDHLQKATDDKGGHKARALELVRKAMKQVEKGMAFDRKN